MRKRYLVNVFFVLFVLLFMSTTGGAASLENFSVKNTYTNGILADVSADAWYTDNVSTVYELGLMKGDEYNKFHPQDTLTVAETVTIAARLHSIYHTGADTFAPSVPWYQTYVDYAITNGIISATNYTNYGNGISRQDFAAILYKALPAKELVAMNPILDDVIPDVAASSANGDAIYALYRAGVLAGNDASGTFAPYSTIERSAVAAIISRMVNRDLRLDIDVYPGTFIKTVESVLGVPLGVVIPPSQELPVDTYCYDIPENHNLYTDYIDYLYTAGFKDFESLEGRNVKSFVRKFEIVIVSQFEDSDLLVISAMPFDEYAARDKIQSICSPNGEVKNVTVAEAENYVKKGWTLQKPVDYNRYIFTMTDEQIQEAIHLGQKDIGTVWSTLTSKYYILCTGIHSDGSALYEALAYNTDVTFYTPFEHIARSAYLNGKKSLTYSFTDAKNYYLQEAKSKKISFNLEVAEPLYDDVASFRVAIVQNGKEIQSTTLFGLTDFPERSSNWPDVPAYYRLVMVQIYQYDVDISQPAKLVIQYADNSELVYDFDFKQFLQ